MQARALLSAVALVAGTGALVYLAPPAAAAVTFATTTASAGGYGAARINHAGVAVYDRQTGTLHTGGDASTQVSAASTIKLFIAADLLYRDAHRAITLTDDDYAHLTPMITQSSNSAADYLWKKYGQDEIVRDIIARYHLHQTAVSPQPGAWGLTWMTAHDYALVLGHVADDPNIGPWLTTTMSHSQQIVNGFDQWFGIPASGIRPFAIKQGWTCCGTGDIMNSTGYVGPHWRYAIAIFTSGAAAHHRTYIDEMARRLLPGGRIPGDPARDPIGRVETATAHASTVTVTGWAFDPDRPAAALTVELGEADHVITRTATTIRRADINAQQHISGTHGYRLRFTAPTGLHRYCVRYDNLADGPGDARTCFSLRVHGPPRGALENVRLQAGGRVVITGWAYDPDATTASLPVAVTDNGKAIGTSVAAGARPDIDTRYAITGGHGYAITLRPPATGRHNYCVSAVGAGQAPPGTVVGCRALSVR